MAEERTWAAEEEKAFVLKDRVAYQDYWRVISKEETRLKEEVAKLESRAEGAEARAQEVEA